jgi:spermidine synthase
VATRNPAGYQLDVGLRLSRRSLTRGAAASAGLLGGLTGLRPSPAWAATETVVADVDSPFRRIQIGKRGSVFTMYFFADDGQRFIESRWDSGRPQELDLDYSRTMMAGFLINPEVRRFMMMGLGGGVITNFLFERFPELEIDAVEIDPEVVRLAREFFGVPDHPRYRTHVGDGRSFIERAAAPWDMIMLDAFSGVFVPYHLRTKQAYEACLAKLTPTGVVVANLHNQSARYPFDRQTLAAVFPQRYAFKSELGNQTSLVASAAKGRVGVYRTREHARALAGRFDFDLLGLASRQYVLSDWDTEAAVLVDDFDPSTLDAAAKRHNRGCQGACEKSGE